MILKTTWVPRNFDAITAYPFIFIRPEWALNASLIAHEMVHYKEQKSVWVIPWLLRYAFSKTFRFNAEVRGYRAQIATGGITTDQAVQMLKEYGLDLPDNDYYLKLTAKVLS